MEVAGLALGAVPVILEAIKGYKETYEHIQNFKHATRQLQIVDAQFRVCKLNFLSECRLLLDLVVSDPQLSQEMVVDTQHRMWHDASISDQLVSLLQEHVNACATIIADTTATILALDSRLIKLQIPPVSYLDFIVLLGLQDAPEKCEEHYSTCSNLGSVHDGEGSF
jgi:hypothetical protein